VRVLSGAGAGELQLDGAYAGEVCDGWDNDFNGLVDDGLPPLNGNGQLLGSCVNGLPSSAPARAAQAAGSGVATRTRWGRADEDVARGGPAHQV
jgi:hypothetical protein